MAAPDLARLGIGKASCRSVVVVRRIARALLAEFTQILPLFPDTCRQAPPRRVRVGCRHVELAELSKARLRTGIRGDTVSQVCGAPMSMLLLDAFDRSRTRGTLASRGSRADTRCRIVTTFGAGGSGAPGVLTQSLAFPGGWSGCQRCV